MLSCPRSRCGDRRLAIRDGTQVQDRTQTLEPEIACGFLAWADPAKDVEVPDCLFGLITRDHILVHQRDSYVVGHTVERLPIFAVKDDDERPVLVEPGHHAVLVADRRGVVHINLPGWPLV